MVSIGRKPLSELYPELSLSREHDFRNLLSSDSSRIVGGLIDERCNDLGMGDVNGVTAFDLDDLGTRPLGHCPLGIGRDHLVLCDDQVPARLGTPGRFADRIVKSSNAPRDLRFGHEHGLFCIHVGREGGGKFGPVEE